ncbi:DNA polymerase III subunit delta' [Lysobacter arseniciresistens ZS79]|uniref:DNA-directed DNA polymerase n=1 Tax=Lysobacter arseniciresistens ZS79 TaxID=913325 RepID=A0A0A0F4R9_9GAMM|nr:DNA polymerase III subunit delta' [Lysobacter arseniciresistens]KGM57525.1 DNA polymerase III subunit delta' [Lysobacter arseniciresistens ZS79]
MNTAFAPWQQAVYEQMAGALDAGRLGHGLMFQGPARLGKIAVAERLARRVLCTDRRGDGEPCGQCRDCRLLDAGSHPDFQKVSFIPTRDGTKLRTEIVIEQIRRLSEQLALTPQYGVAQVAIIDPADAINPSAANALLKTLEEPVPGRYLWLVTAYPGRLPATIRSRCQKFEFRLPPREQALAWLQAQGHGAAVATDALDAARGHPGLAHGWIEGGELGLRREVRADLDAITAGRLAVVATAQRWVADEHADLRLRFAADLAVEAAANRLTDPMRARSLAAWFDRANRARDLLRTTVRADLVVVELLMAWRAGESKHATKHATTRQGIDA